MLNKKALANRLAAAKRKAKRKTVTVKKHKRQQYWLPHSLHRSNQSFKIEQAIKRLAVSVRRSSRSREDFICVAFIQEAVNELRKALK